jgi:transcriptional regulator with XRE-family HTH domain
MMHERLKRYFDENGITQQQVASSLGVSLQYINQILNGKKSLGKKNAERLANLYGLSKSFLLTGDGPITTTDYSASIPETEKATNPTVVEQAANIIDLYAGLIKEIESLRADLNAELAAARQEREEAHRLVTTLHDCLFHARTITGLHIEEMPMAAESNEPKNI